MGKNYNFRDYRNVLQGMAFKIENSRGRRYPIETISDGPLIGILDGFLVDGGNICLSKSYRRLFDKTQVFINHGEHIHVRNRGIHTEEVETLAVRIASLLGLNINLVRAIGLAHDIGHAPYGHLGEKFISVFSGCDFRHEVMSVVMAQAVERGGVGLNLLWEVLEGVLYHSSGKNSMKIDPSRPLEYAVVLFSDKISYTFSDFNDALRFGVIKKAPPELLMLGDNQRERVLNCVLALAKESSEKGYISFHEGETAQIFEFLRQWAFQKIYEPLNNGRLALEAWENLSIIHKFLAENNNLTGFDPLFIISLLTDNEAIRMAEIAKQPTVKNTAELKSFSFMEFINRFAENYQVNIFDAGLRPEFFSQANI